MLVPACKTYAGYQQCRIFQQNGPSELYEVAFSISLACLSPAVCTGPCAEVHQCSPQASSFIQVSQDLLTSAQLPVMDPPNLATIKGLIKGMHIDRCLGGRKRPDLCVYCVFGCKLRRSAFCFFEGIKKEK